jgi:hypothetical protein
MDANVHMLQNKETIINLPSREESRTLGDSSMHRLQDQEERINVPSWSKTRKFTKSSVHLLVDEEKTINIRNWKEVRDRLPTRIGRIVEYGEVHNGTPYWTCTPDETTLSETLPLTIAGVPVIIPVLYPTPIWAGIAPPADPLQEAIQPYQSLPEKTIQTIFKYFPDAIGFYVLLNGFLQLLVPSEFDLVHAQDKFPTRFGGLRVSYIPEKSGPQSTHASDPNVQIGPTAPSLGSFGAAVPQVRNLRRVPRSKLGVKTCDRAGNTFVTISTHLVTRALMENNLGVTLETFKNVNIHSENQDGLLVRSNHDFIRGMLIMCSDWHNRSLL